MYSHKCVVAAEGKLRIDGQEHAFPKDQSYGLIDIHKGFYPFVMKWHWATGARFDDDGGLIGFNLTNNQVVDQRRYNENCLWMNGKRNLLPPVRFSFDRGDPRAAWRVRDDGGRVDLQFQPAIERNVDLNLLLLRSRYRGPYGSFSGNILADDGTPVPVDGCFGMAEDFYLRG